MNKGSIDAPMETDDLDSAVDNEIDNIAKDDQEFEKFLSEELGIEFTVNHVIKETQTQLPARMDTGQEEYEWRAMDDKALFEALTRVGYGNWKDAANYINTTLGTNISPAEVERHYNIHYIDGLIGRLCWTWMFTDSVVKQLSRFPFTIRGHHDKLQSNKDNCSNIFRDIPQAELDSLGYLPKRDDFEREFDNEAETLISNLTLGSESEDDIEKKFKLAQIDVYQRRLINRFRKKLIIRVNELIKLFLEVHKNEFFKDSLQARRDSNSKIFKDFQEKYPMFMPFVRYLRKPDLTSLFQDVATEQVLKIMLKKVLLFSTLSTSNLDNLKNEDKIKMIQVFNKAINQKVEQNTGDGKAETNMTDNSSTKLSTKLTKNDSIDVEDLDDMDETDIMNVLFADENQADRECLNLIINHKSIQSLSRSIADFIQKSGDVEFMKEMSKFINQQQSSYWKNETENETLPISSSPKKKMKPDPDSWTSEADESESLAHLLSDTETKLCAELKIEASLFVKMKNVLIKVFVCIFLIKKKTFYDPSFNILAT